MASSLTPKLDGAVLYEAGLENPCMHAAVPSGTGASAVGAALFLLELHRATLAQAIWWLGDHGVVHSHMKLELQLTQPE